MQTVRKTQGISRRSIRQRMPRWLAMLVLLSLLPQRTLPPCDVFEPLLTTAHAGDHYHEQAHPHAAVAQMPHAGDAFPHHQAHHKHTSHADYNQAAPVDEGGSASTGEPHAPHPVEECCSPTPDPALVVTANFRLLPPRLLHDSRDSLILSEMVPSTMATLQFDDAVHCRDGPASIDGCSQYVRSLPSGRSPPLFA